MCFSQHNIWTCNQTNTWDNHAEAHSHVWQQVAFNRALFSSSCWLSCTQRFEMTGLKGEMRALVHGASHYSCWPLTVLFCSICFVSVTGSRMWRRPIHQPFVTGHFPAPDRSDRQLLVSVTSVWSHLLIIVLSGTSWTPQHAHKASHADCYEGMKHCKVPCIRIGSKGRIHQIFKGNSSTFWENKAGFFPPSHYAKLS